MPTVVFVLHAHLPWVLTAPDAADGALEARWVFEAAFESHLPLLAMLVRRHARGRATPLTVSLSPSLTAMWSDPRFAPGMRQYLAAQRDLADAGRTVDPSLGPALDALLAARAQRLATLEALPHGLAVAWAEALRDARGARWSTLAAHPFAPAYAAHPWLIDAALELGLAEHAAHTRAGRPEGLWLPECGWAPWLDPRLARAGVTATVLEANGVLGAAPPPREGLRRPVKTPGGLTVLPRDPITARLVWDRHDGYPGHPHYRDFYADLAQRVPPGRRGCFEDRAGAPLPSGLKLWAVGPRGAPSRPRYEASLGSLQVQRDAYDFAEKVRAMGETVGRDAVVVAAFDAELFGHWWAEGVDWLDHALDALEDLGQPVATASALGDAARETVMPGPSSWGEGSFGARWLTGEAGAMTAEVWRLAAEVRRALDRGLEAPARDEMVAATVRLAASDWPFLLREGAAPHYARRRFAAQRDQVVALLSALRRR
ncbi:MAG: hypothetical protein JNK72_06520 [Myxococcales bacterium]|nr:hypothetical protein [Myxococcales bacterium]